MVESRSEFSEFSARRRLPAWLLSSGLHVAVLLTVAFLFQPREAATTLEDAPRPVGIVVAATTPRRVVYAEESGELPAVDATAAARQDTSPSPLPAENVAVRIPGIDLPAADIAAVPAGDGVLSVGTGPSSRVTRLSSEAGDQEFIEAERARRNADRPTGPTARLSLFGGAEAEGRRFVFLIDRSKSMGGQGLNALEASRKQLIAQIGILRHTHQFQVISYNQQTHFVQKRELISATDENKAAVEDYFRHLAAFGATHHFNALMVALHLKPDVIFFLTDGGHPYLNEGQLAGIRRASAGATSIHCIQFGSGPRRSDNVFMETLARQNGGSYVYVDMHARR